MNSAVAIPEAESVRRSSYVYTSASASFGGQRRSRHNIRVETHLESTQPNVIRNTQFERRGFASVHEMRTTEKLENA